MQFDADIEGKKAEKLMRKRQVSDKRRKATRKKGKKKKLRDSTAIQCDRTIVR